MTDIFDIAIVGAGPAGSTLARELAVRCPEKRVLLIDGQNEKNKKPCGGLLAPDAQRALAAFDLTLPGGVLADPQIFAVETIDLVSKQVRYYGRHYLNMDRYRFDKWLLSLVPASVKIINRRVTKLWQEDGVFHLQSADDELKAVCVVGADGAGSLVRRHILGHMPTQYVSIQEWYERKGRGLPYYSCIFDAETSDSCSWTIHKDGYMIYGGAFRKQGCREAFEKQRERLASFMGLSLEHPIKREACLVSSPRRMRDICLGKNSAFLIGEAAGLISASSFEGISSALLSGRALAKAFQKAESPHKALSLYRQHTRSLRLKLCTKFYKRAILCHPLLRFFIMKSGLFGIQVEKKEVLSAEAMEASTAESMPPRRI